jgi:LysR family glycine cleavage system transcriptional activator
MRKLPSLNALRVLATVAETGSFSAAASRLGVTQSAVSKQIAGLEADLGQALFDRHHRRVTLTPYGAEVARVATDAFGRMADGLSAVRHARPRQLRIVGDADFIQLWLNPRLSRFERMHRDIRFSLTAVAGLDHPPEGDYDLALIWGEGLWHGCRFEPLLTNHVFPVAAPEYARLGGRAKMPDLAELREDELIHDQTRFWWSAVMGSIGAPAPGADAGRLYNLSVLCLEAAARGDGVTIGDEVTTAGHLQRGNLVCPWPVRLPSHNAYFTVTPGAAPPKDETETFRRWIRQEAEDHTAWFRAFWHRANPG